MIREDLFPTPLYKDRLILDEAKLKQSIKNTRIRGGIVSHSYHVLNNTFDWLYKPIDKFVKDVMIEIGFDTYSIFTSWLTVGLPGNIGSPAHIHSNSCMSGVLYLTHNPSPLLFTTPTLFNWWGAQPERTGVMAPQRLFKPIKGDIYMFPSSVYHAILPNQNPETRYSLAFNVLPTGVLGNWDSTVNLQVYKTE